MCPSSELIPPRSSVLPQLRFRYNSLQATVSHRFSKGLYFSERVHVVQVDRRCLHRQRRLPHARQRSEQCCRFARSFRLRSSPALCNQPQLRPAFPGQPSRCHGIRAGWLGGRQRDRRAVGFSHHDCGCGRGNDYNLASYPVATANFAPGFSCANALQSGNLATKIANWVNPAAYAPDLRTVRSGTNGFGDSPRNCILGPNQVNVDFTLGKMFKWANGRISASAPSSLICSTIRHSKTHYLLGTRTLRPLIQTVPAQMARSRRPTARRG